MRDISKLLIRTDKTLREVIRLIDSGDKGAALVVDERRRLLFVITDGDMRRAMLHGMGLETTIEQWAQQKGERGNRNPLTMPLGSSPEELLKLMRLHSLRHIPLVDPQGRVQELALLEEFLPEQPKLSAVVMAGGFGQRLRPLTDKLPKPMLPIGDKPLMEHIVGQLREAGIRQMVITTHYKADAIVDHFGDGEKFGVRIGYLKEDKPLGTAGALGLMESPTATQLVINGDVLTQVNFKSMLAFHRESQAVMTVGVREFDFQVPYGVVETQGVYIQRLNEKPVRKFLINAGIYLLEPAVYRHIGRDQKLDMTELINRLVKDGLKVASFPISEYWLDIGDPGSYQRAQDGPAQGK
ncbi:MAG: nucleotidyltransferase family protein [Elusimicrobia bacterium]|nr:nucleotidyltransferase family protein [Elusimicrobiota bacterium]